MNRTPEPSGLDRGRRSDPRLLAYLIAGFGALLVAIATAQPEVAALGSPFLVLAAIGLARGLPDRVEGSVHLYVDRVIEGHDVEGEIRVEWDGVAEVDVMLTGLRGVAGHTGPPTDSLPESRPDSHSPFPTSWSFPAAEGPAVIPLRLRASDWGVHHLGTLWVRARRPGGLLARERRRSARPTVRVLPTPLRIDSLLSPADPHTAAGQHLSRSRGPGTDLAEIRAYQPGDRLRDLSWATSARLGAPWVRTHHPERTGAVLIFLDSFVTEEHESREALARAARAAWAVTSIHLRAQDRVGLVAQGRAAAWVPPQGGRRARLLLLNELLAVGGASKEGRRRWARGGRVVVPSDALIIGVTGLRSHTFMQTLLHERRNGHTTVALVIDTEDLLPPAEAAVDRAARRIWMARRAAERYALDRAGVPTALVTVEHGVGSAVSALRRRMTAVQNRGRGSVGKLAGTR